MNAMYKYLLSLLTLLPLCACSLFMTSIEPSWVEAKVKTNSESVLYEVVHISLQKAGYPVGIGADKGSRTVVSGWYNSEYPFKGKGYRQMATVTYEPHEDEAFTVQVRVQREVNESFRPLDPRYSDWQEAEDNPTEAGRILQYVRSFLAGDDLDVGADRSSPERPEQ